jgi:hypothetical protein
MSIANFKPTIWSANVLSVLQKTLVFASPMITNRNYEGEVANFGDRVKINQIGDVDVQDYTPGTDITYQDMDSAAQFLDIDQQKYFAINLDDVDAAQVNVDLMVAYAQQAAYKVADTVDQSLAGLYGQAGVTSGLGTTASPLLVTSADSATSYTGVMQMFTLINTALTKSNVPKQGRYVILPPEITGRLFEKNTSLVSTAQQQEAVTNGYVTNFAGFNIFESNNVANVGTTASPKYKILAGSNIAMTFAQQISKIEGVRRENKFADAVRGLYVYGRKVVRPDALACATVTPS